MNLRRRSPTVSADVRTALANDLILYVDTIKIVLTFAYRWNQLGGRFREKRISELFLFANESHWEHILGGNKTTVFTIAGLAYCFWLEKRDSRFESFEDPPVAGHFMLRILSNSHEFNGCIEHFPADHRLWSTALHSALHSDLLPFQYLKWSSRLGRRAAFFY